MSGKIVAKLDTHEVRFHGSGDVSCTCGWKDVALTETGARRRAFDHLGLTELRPNDDARKEYEALMSAAATAGLSRVIATARPHVDAGGWWVLLPPDLVLELVQAVTAPRKRLFVWADCFHDYSAGLAFAFADDAEEARALISEKAGYTLGDLARTPEVFEVTGEPVAFYVHGGS